MQFINPGDAQPLSNAYSQAVRTESHIYLSGLVAVDGAGKTIGIGDVGTQTTAVLQTMENVLNEAGANRTNVVSVTAYIKNLEDYAEYALAYARFFAGHRPARATVRADLVHRDFLIEIQAIAEHRDT